MRVRGSGVGCGVVEWVKGWKMRNWLRLYRSSVDGLNRRGRPLGRWKDKVKEYVSEKGVRGNGLEWARRECMDRERWRSICLGHPLGDASRGSKALELLMID